MAYTEDEVASAYTYYGIELTNVAPKDVDGTLEDVVISVIEHPPFARAISMLPALLVKNKDSIDFERLIGIAKQNPESAAKLGYILEVTIAAMQELKGTRHYRELEKEFRTLQTTLQPSDIPLCWMPEELSDWIPEKSHLQDKYEKKWGVYAKFRLDSFKRHIEEYIRDA